MNEYNCLRRAGAKQKARQGVKTAAKAKTFLFFFFFFFFLVFVGRIKKKLGMEEEVGKVSPELEGRVLGVGGLCGGRRLGGCSTEI